MAYCTATNVQGEIKGCETFSTSTYPTLAKVEEWIAEADALINGKLADKYVVPVTGSDSMLILRSISINLVKAKLQDFLDVKGSSEATDQGKPGESPRKQALEALEAIAKGSISLRDAVLADSNAGVRSDVLNDTDAEATFTQDDDAW